MAEECHQSDGKRVLRACTESGILPGASGVLSKAVCYDCTSFFFFFSWRAARPYSGFFVGARLVHWLHITIVQPPSDHGRDKLESIYMVIPS